MCCSKSRYRKVSPSDQALAQAVASAHLGAATEKVLKWCSDEQHSDVSAVLAAESALSQKLGLKVLERKRLLFALGGDPNNAKFDFIPPVAGAPVAGATIQLDIRMITGSTLEVDAKTSQSVLSLKTQLQRLDSFLDGKHFVLVLKGEELKNNQNLSAYQLQSRSELHLIIRESGDAVRDVDGLLERLEKANLQQYVTELRAWCAQFGAISLEEIRDNAEHVAAFVGIAEVETKRLWSALGVEEARAEKIRLEDERRKKLAEEEAQLSQKLLKEQQRKDDIKECIQFMFSTQFILLCGCSVCFCLLLAFLIVFIIHYSSLK